MPSVLLANEETWFTSGTISTPTASLARPSQPLRRGVSTRRRMMTRQRNSGVSLLHPGPFISLARLNWPSIETIKTPIQAWARFLVANVGRRIPRQLSNAERRAPQLPPSLFLEAFNHFAFDRLPRECLGHVSKSARLVRRQANGAVCP